MPTKWLSFTMFTILLAASLLVMICMPVRADNITANKFTFKSNDPNMFPTANDFHLKLSRGQFVGEPASDKFPNNTNADGKTNTDFSGNTINNGDSTNVKFKSNQRFPTPIGFFTSGGRNISGDVRSLDLSNNPIAVIQSGNGFDITLDLVNEFGLPLTGSVTAYVNSGFSDHFTLEDFDTLRNARSVFSASSFQLGLDQGFFNIPVHLNSADEYLLVTGIADAGDGLGGSPFSAAFSPVSEIPEPSTIAMMIIGTITIGLHRARSTVKTSRERKAT